MRSLPVDLNLLSVFGIDKLVISVGGRTTHVSNTTVVFLPGSQGEHHPVLNSQAAPKSDSLPPPQDEEPPAVAPEPYYIKPVFVLAGEAGTARSGLSYRIRGFLNVHEWDVDATFGEIDIPGRRGRGRARVELDRQSESLTPSVSVRIPPSAQNATPLFPDEPTEVGTALWTARHLRLDRVEQVLPATYRDGEIDGELVFVSGQAFEHAVLIQMEAGAVRTGMLPRTVGSALILRASPNVQRGPA